MQVVREGDRLITDLFTKPTDTHQLLHHTSCHPGHTKKGIPYSQVLWIRRICSEDRFFDDRVGELKGWLCNRGYGENEVLEQISKVRGRDRLSLLDRQPKTKDDKRIPLVLTYHPALNKVYEILKENPKLIFVDDEHKEMFQNKTFLSFRRAKNLKDQIVRAKSPGVCGPPLAKGTYRCNGMKSCQICNVIMDGDSFENSDENRSFKNFSRRYNCNSENVIYLQQC